MTKTERRLVSKTEREALVELDEDALLELHGRVRRARTKYLKTIGGRPAPGWRSPAAVGTPTRRTSETGTRRRCSSSLVPG
jgi:hypothetical protein